MASYQLSIRYPWLFVKLAHLNSFYKDKQKAHYCVLSLLYIYVCIRACVCVCVCYARVLLHVCECT